MWPVDVPFGGFIDNVTHLGGQIRKKTKGRKYAFSC